MSASPRPWDAGLFYCEFWRSRSRHIWAPLPRSHYGLRRSTDVQAMLSPYRIEVDINRPVTSYQVHHASGASRLYLANLGAI
jgi:hypothetical protein